MRKGNVRLGLVLILALLMLLVGQAVLFAAPLGGPALPQAAPDYSGAIINGVPLLFVIIGLVQALKLAGAKGNQLRLAAIIIGTALGTLYQISIGTTPTFAYWFGAAVYGVGLGIVSFGLVDAMRDSIASAVRDEKGARIGR